MIHFNLNGGCSRDLQILCLGSHSDDLEIGCGGTILRLAEDIERLPSIGLCLVVVK